MADYALPTIASIRSEILTTWQGIDPDISTSKYSDAWIRAHGNACALWGIYRYCKWIEEQSFPDTADDSHLEKHAGRYGLTFDEATTSSSSTVRLTGNNGTVVPSGLEMVHVDGTAFETTSGGTIGVSEELDVAAISTTEGEIANKEADETLTLTSPPAGVDFIATIVVSFTGGANREAPEELLARLLERLQDPPAGGKKTDYSRWALEVSGVAETYVYPLRRGPGTCDVVILTTASDRLPTADLLEAVQEKIDEERPVTAYNTMVLAPSLKTQVVIATVWLEDKYDWSTVKPLVEAAIQAEFQSLAPGETLYLSQLEAAISNVEGVLDRDVSLPVANVGAQLDDSIIELVSPGTITLTEGT